MDSTLCLEAVTTITFTRFPPALPIMSTCCWKTDATDVDLRRRCGIMEVWPYGTLTRMLVGATRECQGNLDGPATAITTELRFCKRMGTMTWKKVPTATMGAICLLQAVAVSMALVPRELPRTSHTPTRTPMLVEILWTLAFPLRVSVHLPTP
jgi:hypothetical protein